MRKRLAYLLPLIFCLPSCSLDPVLTSSYPETVAWASEENVGLYINRFYPLLGSGYYESSVRYDCYSDILKMNNPTANENLVLYGSNEITPQSETLGYWSSGHSWAIQCCRFLDQMRKYGSGLSDEFKLSAEAQIRFFRAHVYFEMAKRYGASVIIYKELPPVGVRDRARCEPAECWDFIASDLDFAADNLPATAAAGRLTKGAAFALKARAMLYAKRWKAASDACHKVDSLGLYDLEPEYGDLFLKRRSSGVSVESIAEFGFVYPELAYSFDRLYCPSGEGGAAYASPTDDLVSAYQMADGSDFSWDDPVKAADPYAGREKRFYASILYHGCTWKDRTMNMASGPDATAVGGGTTSTGYYMRKLMDPDQKYGKFTDSDLTYYYMRYAEVLLIAAEALAEQNRLDEALGCLNRVRRRAGFTTDLSTSSKTVFMEWLRHERMVELAFEGHRFWDVRRWGLGQKCFNNVRRKGVMPVETTGSVTYTVINADTKPMKYPSKYDRLPIPSSEVQRNALMKQFEEWI